MRSIINSSKVILVLCFCLFLKLGCYAQTSDYYTRQAQSYQREAAYYQRQAESYQREADYYNRLTRNNLKRGRVLCKTEEI